MADPKEMRPVESDVPRLRLFLEDTQAVDALFREALNHKGSQAFHEFLDFVVRFNRFSAFNTLLIHVQRPGATAVGTRRQWADVNRRIVPAAVPIIILHPFGPVGFVYEYADTYGPNIPGSDAGSLNAFGNVPKTTWDKTGENTGHPKI